MLIDFFYTLRAAGLPVSVKELLTLLEALKLGLIGPHSLAVKDASAPPLAGGADTGQDAEQGALSMEDFYFLARMTLIKDERHFDKFDRAFQAYFKGLELLTDSPKDMPLQWLKDAIDRLLSPEDKARAKMLDWDDLMKTLEKRLKEQQERHDGGSKWIGTGGTSPFGHSGFNPQGIRIGGQSGQRRALKVWEQRAYQDYDDGQALGTRNIKMAVRRLRRFAREGQALELDLDDTIHSTAANAGFLDIKMVPEKHNHVKVLLLMDVGGSMDDHVQRVSELFSAVSAELKHLEFYYFHNCVYDYLWKNNHRRFAEKHPTWDVIRKYNKDYKLIFVGDATMSPYEIVQPGGSVEYNNEEAGAVWLTRLTQAFPKSVWINPEPQGVWGYRQSIDLVSQLMSKRMFALTLSGLEQAMRELNR